MRPQASRRLLQGSAHASVNTDLLYRYIRDWQKAGKEKATVNRTLALLKQMMNIARRDGKLTFLPYFSMLNEQNVRTVFAEGEMFVRLRKALPERLHPLIVFLYTTGCRVGVAKAIRWAQFEEDGAKMYVRLDAVQTKHKEPLMLRLTSELAEVLRKLLRKDEVFDATNLRRAWSAATIAVKVPELLIHDPRRSGPRNLLKCWSSRERHHANRIGGWRPASMFRRYGIVSTA
jgi:integrase